MKLWVDDDARTPGMEPFRYPPSAGWVIAVSVQEAILAVQAYGYPEELGLDHDLGEETVMKFLTWLFENFPNHKPPTYSIHSKNPWGCENIEAYLSSWLKTWSSNKLADMLEKRANTLAPGPCPICHRKMGSEGFCSEFCAEVPKKDLEVYLGAKKGDFCLYPCSECGCIIEDEYNPKEICSRCEPRVSARERKLLLIRALQAILDLGGASSHEALILEIRKNTYP
jgi:hypothetical protein